MDDIALEVLCQASLINFGPDWALFKGKLPDLDEDALMEVSGCKCKDTSKISTFSN